MRWKPYPKYKESGVQWLGAVPEHWDITRLRRIADGGLINGLFKTKDAYGHGAPLVNVFDVYQHDFQIRTEELGRVAVNSEELDKYAVVSGDLVFVRSSLKLEGIGVSALICGVHEPTVFECHLVRLRPRRNLVLPKFLSRYLSSTSARHRLVAVAQTTTMTTIAQEGIASLEVLLPEQTAEQEQIVAVVDRETAKIDTLIAKQERLIELVHEKRQALISHAVTKGLNPDAPMKSSGVEWLGEVPAHWSIVRHKSIFREVDQRSISDQGTLLTVSHITGITPRSEKNVNMFLAETLEGYKLCLAGDLVINTMWAWMGALGISKHDGLVSPSYNVYRPRDSKVLHPAYFDFLCRIPSYVVNLKAHSTGVWESRLRLYPDVFLASSVCLPPVAEQIAIAEFLHGERSKIDLLVEKANDSIALMREHRAALISAAVTGKIDVREVQSSSHA